MLAGEKDIFPFPILLNLYEMNVLFNAVTEWSPEKKGTGVTTKIKFIMNKY